MSELMEKVAAGGHRFANFDGPTPGTSAGAATNMNGISNEGQGVSFYSDTNGVFHGFVVKAPGF